MEIRKLDFNNVEMKSKIHESEFLKEFLKHELFDVLKDKELRSNNLYIYKSYIYEKEDYIEIGIYIINTSKKDILVKSVPLVVTCGENKINKVLHVEEEIKTAQAVFKELRIKKILLEEFYDLNSFEINIGNLNNLEKYEPIELEFNIEPKFKGYIIKREFNKFIANLPKINENSLAINIFKKMYIEDGYFISLIIRNSFIKDLNIGTLPIVITTSNNLIIYESVIKFENNSCLIPANKVVMKNILIPFKEILLLPKHDGMDFKILFKNL